MAFGMTGRSPVGRVATLATSIARIPDSLILHIFFIPCLPLIDNVPTYAKVGGNLPADSK